MTKRISTMRKRRFAIVTFVLVILIAPAVVPSAQAQGLQRPISDFIKAQGTFCVDDGHGGCTLFVPPTKNFIGETDPFSKRELSTDYAGLADAWINSASGGKVSFGTTFSGSITERPLADGRAEVDVHLRTEKTLVWAIEFDSTCSFDPATCPLLFGHRAPDVLFGGQDAALGESFLYVRFINTAPGAPLPDLEQLFFSPLPGQVPEILYFTAHAFGTLRSAFGVPDGTPGEASTTQVGQLASTAPGVTACTSNPPDRLNLKCSFPAQHIDLKVVGH